MSGQTASTGASSSSPQLRDDSPKNGSPKRTLEGDRKLESLAEGEPVKG